MQILENHKLVGLSTERLLNIKKELNKIVGRRAHDISLGDATEEDYLLFKKYEDFLDRVKEILNTREHVESKPSKKKGHDKRGRRQAAMSKRIY